MKKVVLVYLLTVCVIGNSQRRYAADRYFKEFAYKKSAELYKNLYDNGDDSQMVLERLGDSYYYNTQSASAEHWYRLLLDRYEKTVSPEYIFRFAQTLKSNGKVKESDLWLEKLRKVKGGDKRALALEKNKNYFSKYTNKKKTFVDVKDLNINTKYSDFGGFIYGNELYFASTRPEGSKFDKRLYNWNNQPYLNVYKANSKLVGEKEKKVVVDDVVMLTSINSEHHESNVVITADGNTMYFTRDSSNDRKSRRRRRADKVVINLKIYKAELINGRWANIKELPFNNDAYSCGHPALSADERTLYFVSTMPGGYGATDIYKVAIYETGTYGEPENLGGLINTEGREMFPSIDRDNTLYFSSDGHLGLGALDIFESKEIDGEFTEPENIGAPVNSRKDDFAFGLSYDKTYGYFSSNRKGGRGDDDIYSFIVYSCEKEVKGIITDSRNGKPISGVIVRLVDEKGKPIKQKISETDGSYTFKKVPCERKLSIAVTKEDYRNFQKDIETNDKNNEDIIINISLESLIVENQDAAQIVINPIYFDFNLYNIREDAEYELEHIVSVMKNNPDMMIKIESHTDSRGPKAYNRYLSDKRAKSTRDYIVSRGISKKRIVSAIGYGEDKLLNNCNDVNQYKCTEEQHQENRRSYFYIVNPKKKEEKVVEKATEQKEKEKETTLPKKYYIVQPKDTLYSIARKNGISVNKLRKLNKLSSNTILIGQRIKVRE